MSGCAKPCGSYHFGFRNPVCCRPFSSSLQGNREPQRTLPPKRSCVLHLQETSHALLWLCIWIRIRDAKIVDVQSKSNACSASWFWPIFISPWQKEVSPRLLCLPRLRTLPKDLGKCPFASKLIFSAMISCLWGEPPSWGKEPSTSLLICGQHYCDLRENKLNICGISSQAAFDVSLTSETKN